MDISSVQENQTFHHHWVEGTICREDLVNPRTIQTNGK